MFKRPSVLALTDDQLAMIKLAAETLPPSGRTEFLERVGRHLSQDPTDEAVLAAIDAQLEVGRIPTFLCDAKKELHK